MTATQHTKGPWYYDGEFIRAETKDDGEVTVATVRGWSQEHRDEEYANGKLIAAAPELLDLLHTILMQHKTDGAYSSKGNASLSRAMEERVEHLIAKATGGQNV